LRNSVQQEAEDETEAVEFMTAAVHECEGLEGGFISFDQRVLMFSTIVRLVENVMIKKR
jgi:hypothetical protein